MDSELKINIDTEFASDLVDIIRDIVREEMAAQIETQNKTLDDFINRLKRRVVDQDIT